MMENHEMKTAELIARKDHIEGFIDQALDQVLCRHSELHRGEKGETFLEDPMDGTERMDLVAAADHYGINDLFSDVACGAPKIR